MPYENHLHLHSSAHQPAHFHCSGAPSCPLPKIVQTDPVILVACINPVSWSTPPPHPKAAIPPTSRVTEAKLHRRRVSPKLGLGRAGSFPNQYFTLLCCARSSAILAYLATCELVQAHKTNERKSSARSTRITNFSPGA